MAREIQNQAVQDTGLYFACGVCGRWQRAAANPGGLKCKSCGALEKVSNGALDFRVPYSQFDPATRQHNLGLTSGRFRFLCPSCGKRYEFPLSLEGQRLLCQKCKTAFKAKSYMEDHDNGAGQLPAPRSPAVQPSAVPQAAVAPPPAPPTMAPSAMEGPPVRTGRVGAYGKICAYDHTPIEDDDEWVECPACKLPYHKECWEENFGCAALGCAMVDALKPKADQDRPQAGPEDRQPLPPPPSSPLEKGREAMWMGVAGGAVLPGLLTFGLPNLIMCGITVFLMARRKPGTRYGWLILAFLVSFLAFWGGFWCTLYLFGD